MLVSGHHNILYSMHGMHIITMHVVSISLLCIASYIIIFTIQSQRLFLYLSVVVMFVEMGQVSLELVAME